MLMNILNLNFPKIDPSVVWTVPTNLTQQAWNSLGGLKLQLPRIEANFFSRESMGDKPLIAMKNELTVKKFSFKKSLSFGKVAPYAR